MDENNSKAMQFAKQSIKALIHEPIAQTIKASFPDTCFTIHPNQNPNAVVVDEAKVLSTLQFQYSDNKGIHVNEITERCRMHQFGFVDENYIIFFQIQQKINRFLKKTQYY